MPSRSAGKPHGLGYDRGRRGWMVDRLRTDPAEPPNRVSHLLDATLNVTTVEIQVLCRALGRCQVRGAHCSVATAGDPLLRPDADRIGDCAGRGMPRPLAVSSRTPAKLLAVPGQLPGD